MSGSRVSWHELEPVGLEFLETAPRKYIVEAEVAAPRAAVWRAFADASSWAGWFPGVEVASYPAQGPPFGVGTLRTSTVAGERFEEYMLAWDEPSRWAYYIARTTMPIARAQLECTEFEDCPDGTRVRWILATDPLQDLEFMADGTPFEEFLQTLHDKAMSNLETQLRSN